MAGPSEAPRSDQAGDFDLLIKNGAILPLAEGLPDFIPCGYVAIRDRAVAAIGAMADLPAGVRVRNTMDAAGGLVMPGLVNAHTHGAMTVLRGLADDLPLMTWLHEHIFPAEARLVNPELVYWGTKLAALELLLSGTTCVADGYFHEDAAARAYSEAGMRAVAAQGVIDFPAPGVPDPSRNVAHAAEYIEQWQGAQRLITPAVFCHSPYTCSTATLVAAKELARAKKVAFLIHVAETKEEREGILAKHGATPVQYLHRLGVLDQDTVCVHGIWVDARDIEILAQTGSPVVHCPESSMKLGCGIAPIPLMLGRGIVVGLGTDGCASNNDLDLFREMDSCAKLHKVKEGDPTVLPARQVLALATKQAAQAIGLGQWTGSLAPGLRADLVIMDLAGAHLVPLYHAASHLVYAAKGADVRSVIIDGQVVVQDREVCLFDQAEVLAKVREITKGL